jgi:hypothetical protein
MVNVSHKSEKSRNNSIVYYGTRHISLRTSRTYVKKGEIWKSNGHGPVENVVLLFYQLAYGYDAVGC